MGVSSDVAIFNDRPFDELPQSIIEHTSILWRAGCRRRSLPTRRAAAAVAALQAVTAVVVQRSR